MSAAHIEVTVRDGAPLVRLAGRWTLSTTSRRAAELSAELGRAGAANSRWDCLDLDAIDSAQEFALIRALMDYPDVLEEAARSEKRTVAQLLDEIVAEHLRSGSGRGDAERQRRLHARAASFAGSIAGRDQRRAERARDLVRARLRGAGRAR